MRKLIVLWILNNHRNLSNPQQYRVYGLFSIKHHDMRLHYCRIHDEQHGNYQLSSSNKRYTKTMSHVFEQLVFWLWRLKKEKRQSWTSENCESLSLVFMILGTALSLCSAGRARIYWTWRGRWARWSKSILEDFLKTVYCIYLFVFLCCKCWERSYRMEIFQYSRWPNGRENGFPFNKLLWEATLYCSS